jgi:hypothetical protein
MRMLRCSTETRGPFDVRAGDFNIGGSVDFTTLDLPPSGLTLMGGQYGTVRGNGIYSGKVGDLSGFASLLIDDGSVARLVALVTSEKNKIIGPVQQEIA